MTASWHCFDELLAVLPVDTFCSSAGACVHVHIKLVYLCIETAAKICCKYDVARNHAVFVCFQP